MSSVLPDADGRDFKRPSPGRGVCGGASDPALKHRAIVKRPTGRGWTGFQASLAGTRGRIQSILNADS
jgi:hypothetical protein